MSDIEITEVVEKRILVSDKKEELGYVRESYYKNLGI